MILLTAKLGNGGKDCFPNFIKVPKTNEYILYASSHVEDTTKVTHRKLKKIIIDELIDHPIDKMLAKKRER